MVELVIDRSQSHVNLLKSLRKKPWSSMSEDEQSAWYDEAAKGGYNYTDLNRVETAVAELAGQLGLTLTTKTNWTCWDRPVQSDMERYLGNVVAIRDACSADLDFPTLPSTMSGLTYSGANSIEKVLLMVYEKLNEPDEPEHECVLGEFILGECTLGDSATDPDVPDEPSGSEDADFVRSGEIYCGEVL